ncbi:MAG: class I SAM-dependent methyltransferase [Acidimicrobiia bacterium]
MPDLDTPVVDPANADAFAAWDGNDGAYWADRQDYFERSMVRYDDAFFAAASIAATDRVLDVGCGTGWTTRAAARRAVSGHALGVDLSSRMLERARARASADGITNATFLQADAQVHPFAEGSFDVAISRTGTMFFADPVAAFSNIGRSLRPGGRFVQLVWQGMPENEWFVDFRRAVAAGHDLPIPPPDAPGPFALADPARMTSLLAAAGFVDAHVEGHSESMEHGRTPDDAFANVSGMGFVEFMLRDVDEVTRARALADLRASIDAHATDNGVLYGSVVWIVTARRP